MGIDAEAVVDLLVSYSEHLWRSSACQTPEERHLGLITVTFLARATPKTESESTADVQTGYNKWSRNVMLLRIDAYQKYEHLRMLNLLTVLSVRLLATVLTVLAVPVLELELVFECTLCRQFLM